MDASSKKQEGDYTYNQTPTVGNADRHAKKIAEHRVRWYSAMSSSV
jgi:hypothetical protein